MLEDDTSENVHYHFKMQRLTDNKNIIFLKACTTRTPSQIINDEGSWRSRRGWPERPWR